MPCHEVPVKFCARVFFSGRAQAEQKRSSKGRFLGGQGLGSWWGFAAFLLVGFAHPCEKTESESGPKMLDDLSGQGIELNLFPATFHEAIIDFSHPLGQRQF